MQLIEGCESLKSGAIILPARLFPLGLGALLAARLPIIRPVWRTTLRSTVLICLLEPTLPAILLQ